MMDNNFTKSLNPSQEEEITSIDAQLEHVNKILKWTIADLEKFINTIKARISAEETYLIALVKIVKLNNYGTTMSENNSSQNHNNLNVNSGPITENSTTFENYFTTFQKATSQYETSIEKTIEIRRGFISCLKNQVELLTKVKESHEQRRKKVKAVLSEKNTNYINFRTRDIIKLHRAYFNKCTEYANLQQQTLISSHEEMMNDQHHLSPQMMRISSDETRLSIDSIRDDHSISSHETTSSPSYKKNSMSGFITQMRSQLANAAAAGDPSKLAARLAKLKKDINETDNEYRHGIRILEFLRKKQIETAIHAMRHVEAILLGKIDVVKGVMIMIHKQEEDILLNEIKLVKDTLNTAQDIDGKKDTGQFLIEYDKLGFIKPRQIYYDNYYYGRCKDILFGSNLNEYALEHNRTVPLLVTKCIQSVETQGGLEREGIYRVSGRQSSIDQLKNEFEKDEEAVDLDSKDVFTVASVLKIYLRELKQPLFSLTMKERIEYSTIQDSQQRRNILQTKLAELSSPQRDTLSVVIAHLAKVEKYSHVNKMTMKNLSFIFTPALFHDHNQAENAGEWYADKVIDDLILQHETLFVDAENQSKEQATMMANQIPPSSGSVLSLPFSIVGNNIVRRQSSLSTHTTSNHHGEVTRRPSLLKSSSSNIPPNTHHI
ncbi:uncharacterized protein BX663DRAFT_508491 [Cokeromyces recurvatus]|uniref:uncharacterized protein n=1 Tax=Cokeromyces recurvatus TaxID=90255 RepID=UPI0022200C45|nr:uncharacterized protein BX663DRAFT_508491 [Cokeromyces recurvatus]KAI7903408.1 hypothetical protein BX663DRAFT_508491 [Cokeromyces recurvatus]